MILEIPSNSVGGTTYLLRILKLAAMPDVNHVQVVILDGPAQENIYRAINRQLALLHEVTDVHFTHTVTLQYQSK